MRLLLVICVGAALGTSACGSEETTETGAARTTGGTATAGDASSPDGEYEREVSEDEIVTSPGQEPPPAGTWQLTIGETVIQVVDPGGFRFSQELTVSGPSLEIERYVGGDGVFCADDGPSTYTWEIAGDELTLSPESEECRDRELILGATWRRAG